MAVTTVARPGRTPRRVALALQGGGAHGAFTWGVLDRLLQERGIEIAAASGASAGAMNAVVMAHGLVHDGRDGARAALQRFWDAIAARASAAAPALRLAWPMLGRGLAPAQLNPLRIDPLRDIVQEQVDFERLRRSAPLRLFVAATEVGSARLRLFVNEELSADALLASACVPTLHHPVLIDGRSYWDGGLTANPPLDALVRHCDAPDLLAVLLHPWRGPLAPASAAGIESRLGEIAFASTLASQLQGLALAQQAASGRGGGALQRRLRALRLHLIEDEELMRGLDPGSRLDMRRAFLYRLRDRGRRQAARWLAAFGARRAAAVRRTPRMHPGMDFLQYCKCD